jgi:hypothetical protein
MAGHLILAQEGINEHYGLAVGVDQLVVDLDVFGPGRHQAPVGHQQMPLDAAFVEPFSHDGHILGGRHVPAGRRWSSFLLLGIEVAQRVAGRLGHHVSAAHEAILPDRLASEMTTSEARGVLYGTSSLGLARKFDHGLIQRNPQPFTVNPAAEAGILIVTWGETLMKLFAMILP